MPNTAARHLERLTAPFPSALAPAPRPALTTSSALESSAARSVWGALPDLERAAAKKAGKPGSPQAEAGVADDGQREAGKIIASAREQAAEIKASASAQIAQQQAEAQAEGYAAGLQQATREVTAALTQQFDERAGRLRGEVDDLVRSIVDARAQMWQAAEAEIAQLALEIARKVVKTEIDQNPAVVSAVVKDALRRVTNRDSLRVLVHPAALEQVRDNRSDILLALDNVQNLAIDGDQRVGLGGCVIETGAGSIDAKIDTQLEQVEQALRG